MTAFNSPCQVFIQSFKHFLNSNYYVFGKVKIALKQQQQRNSQNLNIFLKITIWNSFPMTIMSCTIRDSIIATDKMWVSIENIVL